MSSALRNLIAIIEEGSPENHRSALTKWEILMTFGKNTAFSALKEIPVLKILIEGYEETLRELGPEVTRWRESAYREISAKAESLLTVENHESFKFQVIPPRQLTGPSEGEEGGAKMEGESGEEQLTHADM